MPRLASIAPVSLRVLLLVAVPACDAEPGQVAPAQAPAAPAGLDCPTYAKALCERSGPDSQHCKSIRDLEGILPMKACFAAMNDLPETEQKLAAERKPCTDLVDRLCKDIGPDTESCRMVKVRTPGFPANQCVAMTDNYPSVLSRLRKDEEKTKPLDEGTQAKLVASARAVSGARDAKVKVVVFSDFQCPFCSKATASVEAVRRNFGDKVYLVFRQFPLTALHEDAELAAEASLAAAEQGKFWEFHDKVFANQGALKRENLETYAKEVGLDLPRFKRVLDRRTYKAAVEEEIALGKSVNVEGTPTLFLNGKIVQNAADATGLVAAIDSELKR